MAEREALARDVAGCDARAGASSPGVVLAVLTGLNGLNYVDRYVGAATLPLILASLALSDAAGRAIAVRIHHHVLARLPGRRLDR